MEHSSIDARGIEVGRDELWAELQRFQLSIRWDPFEEFSEGTFDAKFRQMNKYQHIAFALLLNNN